MMSGLLVNLSGTGVALGGILLAAVLLGNGETPAPITAPDRLPAAREAARVWVCVTGSGYCSSHPRPSGDPCTCLDPLHGVRTGRIRTDRAQAPGARDPWPSRGPAAGDDPMEPWLIAP